MTKTLATFAVAATLAAGAVTLPQDANATCFGCYVGAGVVAGALLGAAIACASAGLCLSGAGAGRLCRPAATALLLADPAGVERLCLGLPARARLLLNLSYVETKT